MKSHITSISAVTLVVADMSVSFRFYRNLGFNPIYGEESSDFASFRAGENFLNLTQGESREKGPIWGRVVFFVDDVDAMYGHVLALGLGPEAEPRNAEWHERYFHLLDPDGNELSFAKPIE
ncbi:MAG: VOC family protein [Chloroflexi bacterium]|nr:VOC family protein [Chloroflexota bacterium]MDA1228120.1 VOC family protein [Chloroflexota bacterium]